MKIKKENNLPEVVFAGRYSESEILSGPELTAKKLFESYSAGQKSNFIQYFFDGRKYSFGKKLFGRQALPSESGGEIITCGLFRFFPLLRKLKPEIIHLTSFERFAVIFFLYRILFNIKIIYNSHGIIRYENEAIKGLKGFTAFKDRFCEHIFLKYSDKIIFPSKQAKDTAEKFYNINSNKILILPNGVEEEFYNQAVTGTNTGLKAVMMHKNSLNNSSLALITETLTTAELPVDLYILSDSDTGIQNKSVKTIKQVIHNNLTEFYSDKLLFLSLNSYDTFSISTAEAMAAGLIPVVTNNTGISSYIHNGVNGFIIKAGSSKELSETLSEISRMGKEQIMEISGNAKNTALKFKWSNIFEMYKNVYTELCG